MTVSLLQPCPTASGPPSIANTKESAIIHTNPARLFASCRPFVWGRSHECYYNLRTILWLYRNSLADFAGWVCEAPYRIFIYVSRITRLWTTGP